MVRTVLVSLVPSSTKNLRPMVYVVISYIMSDKSDLVPLNKKTSSISSTRRRQNIKVGTDHSPWNEDDNLTSSFSQTVQ